MMTWYFEVPDIRYSILTSEGHGGHEEDGEPYNDNLIKRAVTEGIGPGGERLELPMPIWHTSYEYLDDLPDYINTSG